MKPGKRGNYNVRIRGALNCFIWEFGDIYRQSSVKIPPIKNISSNNTLHMYTVNRTRTVYICSSSSKFISLIS